VKKTMSAATQEKTDRGLYLEQNRKIHKARTQLCMELDDCRELARDISGKASLSSLTMRQRWELIEALKAKGARVKNPPLPKDPVSSQGRPPKNGESMTPMPASKSGACSMKTQERPEDVYPSRLNYWNGRFPRPRPGYASNEQLAWIQALWELDFEDNRPGSGLRGFIFRQTGNLKNGPVSDLAFLRSNHVRAIIGPLKKKAEKRAVNKKP
jgi:Bacteriophage Mu, GemA protein